MNYYNEIKESLINNEIYKKVKDYSKNRSDLETYYKVGKLLHNAGKHYGEGIIKEYSIKLTSEINKKYSYRTLFRMKQFYEVFSNQKVSPLATQLTWSHYTELLHIKDEHKLKYYLKIAINNSLTKRQLREKIKNKEYERLSKETRDKLYTDEKLDIKEIIPNPILIENKNNIEIINEKVLHNLILENITDFMKELGNNYAFIDSEYKIKIGDKYNYIDLLLFNIEYNSYVVVELKVTELKKEHIGQIEVYMNYIDNNLKKIFHDKTIGIIICKKDNKFIIEYSSDGRIIAREYKII